MRVAPFDTHDFMASAKSLIDDSIPFVVATLVSVRGSAPCKIGGKAIISQRHIAWGTVGGGKIERATMLHAQTLLAEGDKPFTELITWRLKQDIGMTCGGEVTILFEVCLKPTPSVAVFGAGHIAQELVPLLLKTGHFVHCIDHRDEWLSRFNNHARLTIVNTTDYTDALKQLPETPHFILVTQGHQTDLPVLHAILESHKPRFIGVIGSQQKRRTLTRELAELGLSNDAIASVHCPIGLPIGANTPAEIAISIVGQMISLRENPNKRHSSNTSDSGTSESETRPL